LPDRPKARYNQGIGGLKFYARLPIIHTEKRVAVLNGKRWYDIDDHLREMVETMERMTNDSQYLFGYLLCFLGEEVVKNQGKKEALKEMDWEKLTGLIKSKRKRRWYDQEPVLHKAFNMLYSLNDSDKILIGNQLHLPARLVRRYERRCEDNEQRMDIDMTCDIVETYFTDGADAAEKLAAGK